ncbi:MAG: hypothetical protein ACI9G9_000445 [Psychromonas sp.]|jgi:hypothetical protein
MKHLTGLIILIIGLFGCNGSTKQIQSESFKEQETIKTDKIFNEIDKTTNKEDSLQYEIRLEKEAYSFNETINVTIVAKNITEKELKLWIDSNDYPTGTELTLQDSKGESMVRQYWAIMSSQTYSTEEVEQFKTTIPPDGEFKKEYNLLSIVQLNKDLTKGSYELKYNNAEPVKFQIK